jgi:hypothetical protein
VNELFEDANAHRVGESLEEGGLEGLEVGDPLLGQRAAHLMMIY